MPVARVALFESGAPLRPDDDRRAGSLRALVRDQPGFVAGYHLRDDSGRMMSFTIWDSERALEAAEAAVDQRPVNDRRDLSPSRVERWIVDGTF